jgi:hypothetical protein
VLDLKIVLFVLLLCFVAYSLLRVSPYMNAFAASIDEDKGSGLLQRAFRRAIRERSA